MDYKKIEHDFIKRTLDILDQYDEFKHRLPESHQYEVTLLINSLLGLLLFPQQLAGEVDSGKKNSLRTSSFSKNWLSGKIFVKYADSWGLEPKSILDFGNDPDTMRNTSPTPYESENFTLRNLLRALRNSAAHGGFMAISNDGRQITHIKFTNDAGFHMEIPIASLREFIRRLAESALDQLKDKRIK